MNERDGQRFDDFSGSEAERAHGIGIVDPGHGRAIHGRKVHAGGDIGVIEALHQHIHQTGILWSGIGGLNKVNGGVGVINRQRGIGGRNETRPRIRRIGEIDRQTHRSERDRVVDQRNVKGLDGIAGSEINPAGSQLIVHAQQRGARHSGPINGYRSREAVGADHGEHGIHVAGIGGEISGGKAELAGGLDRINDGQGGIGRRVEERTHRVGQGEEHRAIPFRQEVIDDGNLNVFICLTGIKREHTVGGIIIRTGQGGPIGGRVIADRAGARGGAQAQDINQAEPCKNILGHRAVGGFKGHRIIHIHNREHGGLLIAQAGRSRGVGYEQIDGQVGGDIGIIHHRHEHVFQYFTRREGNLHGGIAVIDAGLSGTARDRGKIDGDGAGTVRIGAAGAAGAADANQRQIGVFIHLIRGRSELEGTGTRDRAAVNSGHMAGRQIVILRKAAANDDHLIGRLQGHGVHCAVGPIAKVNRGIHRTTRQEPGNPITGNAIGLGELTGIHNAVIRLHHQGIYRAVGAIPAGGNEGAVQRAVAVQANQMIHGNSVNAGEIATHQHPAIALNGDGADDVIGTAAKPGGKGSVQRTIRIQPGQVSHHHIIQVGKGTPNDHLTREQGIRGINRHGIDDRIRSHARVKVLIHRAVIVQARNEGITDAIHAAESAARINLPRTADKGFGEGIDRVVRTGARIKAAIQRTVGGQTGDPVENRTVEIGEGPAHQNPVIRLIDQGIDRATGTRETVQEAGTIERTVRIQTGQIIFRHPIDDGETATGNDLAAGLQSQSIDIRIHTGAGIKGRIHVAGRAIKALRIHNLHIGGGRRAQTATGTHIG